jgi:trans-aconitate methyltransferase
MTQKGFIAKVNMDLTRRTSDRLLEIFDALPLVPGLRVLAIGCGPGAAARLVASRIGKGHVLGIDRPAKAIAQAIAGAKASLRLVC